MVCVVPDMCALACQHRGVEGSEAVVVRPSLAVRALNVAFGLAWIFVFGSGLVEAVSDDSAGGVVLASCLLLGAVVFLVRAPAVRVEVRDEELLVRNQWRTNHLSRQW
jgi:hypothetical protein